MFVQHIIQIDNKENTKAPVCWALIHRWPMKVSNVEGVPMRCRLAYDIDEWCDVDDIIHAVYISLSRPELHLNVGVGAGENLI